jgi:hypothetical protein
MQDGGTFDVEGGGSVDMVPRAESDRGLLSSNAWKVLRLMMRGVSDGGAIRE